MTDTTARAQGSLSLDLTDDVPTTKKKRHSYPGLTKHTARQRDINKSPVSSLGFGSQDPFNVIGHIVDFDRLPFYHVSRLVPSENGPAEPATITGRIRSPNGPIDYQLTITPGAYFADHDEVTPSGRVRQRLEPLVHNIQDHKRVVVLRPGHREDSVEKGIRRLAVKGVKKPGEPIYRATFSLYQLKTELDASGHCIKYSDLRESLHILANTSIALTVKLPDGKALTLSTKYISGLILGSKAHNAQYDNNAEVCSCTLNEVVAHSLTREAYQAFQYETYMRLPNFLSRRIFVALSIEWRNANTETDYSRSMNEFILGANLPLSGRLNDDYRMVVKAMEELKTAGVLASYDMGQKETTGRGRAGRDYIIKMRPTAAFVGTQIEAIGDRKKREARHELGLLNRS